jgi:hypothetical protein
LSANQVADGRIDCLGAIDELQYCRDTNPLRSLYFEFRCWNDEKCVAVSELCNRDVNCPLEDDEAFCGHRRRICYEMNDFDRTDVEKALCIDSFRWI